MKADPAGVVAHLRRAEREGEKQLADFLAGEIVAHLELADRLVEIHGRPAPQPEDGE